MAPKYTALQSGKIVKKNDKTLDMEAMLSFVSRDTKDSIAVLFAAFCARQLA
jgi:hypothetical protein